ncbi:L-cysteine:1D-myo-inositol 2-amino-2-deoxy-alpha-D-glucopyranoside ligase [Corynebacterium diphtheriae]|nr:cysteine--1-D-myo-inosityl 2-amino-2-deoxy-alpha-D-glucopyranoside ligase [Corynebacterium diphtheriae bv. mitis]CAB0864848.1 L-cysteine:1D-myo-inositol 2-amino-2-deoxy-alpha-D-glucopyranoside ligase [Corynebacterium diphtheriae]
MQSWPMPTIPSVPGKPAVLSLFDTSDQLIKPVEVDTPEVGVYVCGITPYDSTHLGHAATYLTFDLINRQLIDAGHRVHFVQNITDVDEPLFERALRDGVDWRELGSSQIDLFRSDMENLSVIPPRHYVGAMESIPEVIAMVETMLANGTAYIVESDSYCDIYASITATTQFGYESHYSRELMEQFFAERGGDPERVGKKDSLDALIWRAHRLGEPSWDAPFGAGRPGWHVECSAIATHYLGSHFAIQGGGSDLIFPHHEFSAAHAEATFGESRMAGHYVHTGMIGLDGTKMSKSLGNLVFVSRLTSEGYHPSDIRLGVFAGHYRDDRDWSTDLLTAAQERRQAWITAADNARDVQQVQQTIQKIRHLLANDLNTPAVLAEVDNWANLIPLNDSARTEAGRLMASGLDALLGVKI